MRCPICGVETRGEETVCIRCGYNLGQPSTDSHKMPDRKMKPDAESLRDLAAIAIVGALIGLILLFFALWFNGL